MGPSCRRHKEEGGGLLPLALAGWAGLRPKKGGKKQVCCYTAIGFGLGSG